MKGLSNFGIIVLWVFLGGVLYLHIFQGWSLPSDDKLFFFLLGVGVILYSINSTISKVESTLMEKISNLSSSEGVQKISMVNEKVKDGPFEEFYPNGNLKLGGSYKNGKREGNWKEYFENGILKETGTYKDGKKDGWFYLFDEGGLKIEELVFELGILRESLNLTNKNFNGIKKFYSEGRLVRTLTYEEGKIHYLNDLKINNYGDGGLIYSYGNYKDGVKDGIWVIFNGLERPVWVEYYKDGVYEIYDDSEDFLYSEPLNWKEINLRDLKLTRSGTYHNDKVHGFCKYFGPSGNLESKCYHLNEEGNEIIEFFESDRLILRSTYKDHKLNGQYEEFYENGQLKVSGNYSQGYKIGIWKSYFENGQIQSEGNYTEKYDGVYVNPDGPGKGLFKIGEWKYYFENGQIESFGNYLNCFKNDLWIYYFDNGKIRKKENYKNFKLDGQCFLYHKNGLLEFKGGFMDGIRNGIWEFYHENGGLRLKGEFKVKGKGNQNIKWETLEKVEYYDELILDNIGEFLKKNEIFDEEYYRNYVYVRNWGVENWKF